MSFLQDHFLETESESVIFIKQVPQEYQLFDLVVEAGIELENHIIQFDEPICATYKEKEACYIKNTYSCSLLSNLCISDSQAVP